MDQIYREEAKQSIIFFHRNQFNVKKLKIKLTHKINHFFYSNFMKKKLLPIHSTLIYYCGDILNEPHPNE